MLRRVILRFLEGSNDLHSTQKLFGCFALLVARNCKEQIVGRRNWTVISLFFISLSSLTLQAEDTSKAHYTALGEACYYEDPRYPVNVSVEINGQRLFGCIARISCQIPGTNNFRSGTTGGDALREDECNLLNRMVDASRPGAVRVGRMDLVSHLESSAESTPTSTKESKNEKGEKKISRSYVGKKYRSVNYGSCEYLRGGLPALVNFHEKSDDKTSKIQQSFCFSEAKCDSGIEVAHCGKLVNGQCPLLGYCLDHPLQDVKITLSARERDIEADLVRAEEKKAKKVSFIKPGSGDLVRRHHSRPEGNSVAASKPVHAGPQNTPGRLRAPSPRLGQS